MDWTMDWTVDWTMDWTVDLTMDWTVDQTLPQRETEPAGYIRQTHTTTAGMDFSLLVFQCKTPVYLCLQVFCLIYTIDSNRELYIFRIGHPHW